MTTDEFNARYTLQNQIAHGKSRSFTARESGGERAVMVHFLTEDRHPPGSAIAGLVERLSPQDRAKVIEILSVNLSTRGRDRDARVVRQLRCLAPGPARRDAHAASRAAFSSARGHR